MYKVIILPLAKIDIHESALWYNRQQDGLGKKFTQKIRRKILGIKSNPFAYSVRYENVHTAAVDTFPFMIHFVVDEERKTIIVSAILHTSLNPDKWNNRS